MKKFIVLIVLLAGSWWVWDNYFSQESKIQKQLETDLKSTDYAAQRASEDWLASIDFAAKAPTEIPKDYYGRAATGIPKLAGINTPKDAITFSYLSTDRVILDIHQFPASKVNKTVLDFTMAGDGKPYEKKTVALENGITGYLEHEKVNGLSREIPMVGRFPVNLEERRIVFVTSGNLAVLIRNIALEGMGKPISEKELINLANSFIP